MGAIEDIRKVLQDVVTPDLKALDSKLISLEKRLDGRIDGLEKRVDGLDKKIDTVKVELDKKIDTAKVELEKKIDSGFSAAAKRVEEIKEQQDKIIQLNHDVLMAELRALAFQISSGLAAVSREFNVDRRLQRIEEGMFDPAKPKLQPTT